MNQTLYPLPNGSAVRIIWHENVNYVHAEDLIAGLNLLPDQVPPVATVEVEDEHYFQVDTLTSFLFRLRVNDEHTAQRTIGAWQSQLVAWVTNTLAENTEEVSLTQQRIQTQNRLYNETADLESVTAAIEGKDARLKEIKKVPKDKRTHDHNTELAGLTNALTDLRAKQAELQRQVDIWHSHLKEFGAPPSPAANVLNRIFSTAAA